MSELASEPRSKPVAPLPAPTRWSRVLRWIRHAHWGHIGAWLLFAGAALVNVQAHLWFTSPYPMWLNVDEGYVVPFARRMIEGSWLPYVDAVCHRGPVFFWVSAVGVKLFGANWYSMRALSFACTVAVGVAYAVIGHRRRAPIIAAIALLTFTLVSLCVMAPPDGPAFNAEPMMNVFAMLALMMTVLGLEPGARRPRLSLASAGALASCAFLSKQVGAVVAIPLFLWIAAAAVTRGHTWRERLSWPALFVGSFLAPFVLVILVYAAAGELRTFWFYFFTYNRDYYLAPYLGLYTEKYLEWLRDVQLWLVPALLLLGAVLARLLASTRGLRSFVAAWDRNGFEVTVVLGMVLSGLASNTSLRGFFHYYLQPLVWVGLVLGVAAARLVPRRRSALGLVGVLLIGGPLLYWTASGWNRLETRFDTERRTRGWWEPNSDAAVCAGLDKYSSLDAPIFVWGFRGQIYVNCHRRPASRFVQPTFAAGVVPWEYVSDEVTRKRVVPGSHEALLSDLRTLPPTVIVMSYWSSFNKPMTFYPDLAEFLTAGYCRKPSEGGLEFWVKKRDDGDCP